MNSLSSGYRPFCSYWWKHWLSPRTYFYWLKYKVQRAERGWADCDVWSLDDYLASWLPNALRHLQNTMHGVPMSVFPEGKKYVDEHGNPNDKATQIAEQKWNSVLTKIIVGFDAYQRLTDGLYEPELGPYPTWSGDFEKGMNDPYRRDVIQERIERAKPLQERDRELFKQGMALMTEYFGNLWD